MKTISFTEKIRVASPKDAAAMLAIYAPYVEKTAISFEYAVPALSEFRRRIGDILKRYPWLVYEENGQILGYAYGGPDRTRDAYQWMAEVSVYVSEEARGKGVGTALYDVLLSLLENQNFCLCTALITEENAPSAAFHEKFGFRKIGTLENAGYKNGAWHGMTTYQKDLSDRALPPKSVIPFPVFLKKIEDPQEKP